MEWNKIYLGDDISGFESGDFLIRETYCESPEAYEVFRWERFIFSGDDLEDLKSQCEWINKHS